MKKYILYLASIIFIFLSACKKDKKDDPIPAPSGDSVLVGFTNVLAKPNYTDLKTKAQLLNDAIVALNANPNNVTLAVAQQAWRDVRIPWEMAEGYLLGPAVDFDYDPSTDSWPVNTTDLDSLLSSTNPLELADIDQLQFTLKGYHAIEYILFGVGGTRTASELNARKLKYVVSLSESVLIITTELVSSWDTFGVELSTAGVGSNRYTTRKAAFLEIVGAMQGICDEVANNKMETPLLNLDSTAVESQYAHNATIDFMNNIIGIENAYFSRYNGEYGSSIHDMVHAINASLDNQIQNQITAAITSLQTLYAAEPNYGLAIFNQQGQIFTVQHTIRDLKSQLDQLTNFVEENITN
jgi:putative iron-regulated protein